MNILICAVHWPVASGRYMRDAFRRLGHDVRTVGYHMGEPNEIWGLAVDPKYIWKPDYEIAQGLLIAPADWTPDLVLQMDTHLEFIGGWATRAWPDVPIAIYSVDNHVRDLTKLGTDFDYYFMAHHDGPAMLVDESNPKHHWLPCAYDPAIFTPSPIPTAERKYDVAIVGVPYERRGQIVEAMRAAGLNVFAGYGLLYEEYRDIYHNAKISLCVSAAGDVAQRVFETAAMGCAILSDPCHDFGRLGMAADNHYVRFSNPAEAVEKTYWLLENPDILEQIARFGRGWAIENTWVARAQTILDTIFEGKQ